MILVILALGVLVLIFAFWFGEDACNDLADILSTVCGSLGGLVAIASFITSIVLTCCVVGGSAIDDKIAMYQEENTKIEQQISTIVEEYQKYESDTFEKVTPESAITKVIIYPELKSNTLVEHQIDVYVSNNEKIKELREKKIMSGVYRWWLYFGH